jgi:hypothetical protein
MHLAMKIVHVSAQDINGGAVLAAHRLHRGLQRAGHEPSMFAATRRSQDSSVTPFAPPTGLPFECSARESFAT